MSLASVERSLSHASFLHGNLSDAQRYASEALGIQRKLAPSSLQMALSLNGLGTIEAVSGQIELAVKHFKRALLLLEKLASDSLNLANTVMNLGNIALDRGDLKLARQYLARSLKIQTLRDPGGPAAADSLNNLGNIEFEVSHLDQAENFYARALELWSAQNPQSLDVALAANNLGNVAYERGRLEKSGELHAKALAIRTKLAPQSPYVADSLLNLGNVLRERGDLQAAEDYYRQSLEIYKKLSPDSFFVARSLASLALVARERREVDMALDYEKRALEIFERTTPGSHEISTLLTAMADLARDQNMWDLANQYDQRALKNSETIEPVSIDVAFSLWGLGTTALKRGNLEMALGYFERSLKIVRQIAPSSVKVAVDMTAIAQVLRLQGNRARAKDLLEESLKIKETIAPGAETEAATLAELGKLFEAEGNRSLAVQYYERAVTSIENQIGRLGGSPEARAEFRSDTLGSYQLLIDSLLEQNRAEEAFHALERSRARGFLELLMARDLNLLDAKANPWLGKRQQLDSEYDHIWQEIGDLNPKKSRQRIIFLRKRLQELRRAHDEIAQKIRRESPKLAELQYPEPLQAADLKQTLDKSTLMLSYRVEKQRTIIFASGVDRTIRVITVAMSEQDLSQKVQALRDLTTARPDSGHGRGRADQLRDVAQELYRDLIRPFDAEVARSNRILIIPDGPLNLLPWAALIREDRDTARPGRGWQYLAEWKPIYTALSATVVAGLRRERRESKPSTDPPLQSSLEAFGDPFFPQRTRGDAEGATDVRVRAAIKYGSNFEPLPWTRVEVQRIATLFSPTAQAYIGPDATEERAKSISRNTQIVHFATHAILDERSPLDSAVVLSIPEKFEEGHENGLLQAWEIFEQVRLDADLVVLSACESGLGKEMGGEGLIGLTRAFQYAGARSVMASLWKISDRTTAELMVRFYKHLKDGLPKDEALRAAQMELIHGPIQVKNERGEVEEIDASAPYYWSAFQIYGDWR